MLFSIWVGRCRNVQKSVPQTPQISVVSGGYRGTEKGTGNTSQKHVNHAVHRTAKTQFLTKNH
jgi:hypothetical protein